MSNPTKNLKNIIIKGYEGIAGVLKAIKNSDSNKIITDIRTLSISKNRTIESIENKDYDADKIHQNIKHSFESKKQTIKSIKNKDYDADKKTWKKNNYA